MGLIRERRSQKGTTACLRRQPCLAQHIGHAPLFLFEQPCQEMSRPHVKATFGTCPPLCVLESSGGGRGEHWQHGETPCGVRLCGWTRKNRDILFFDQAEFAGPPPLSSTCSSCAG